ncbi:RdRp protein [Euonymus yellow vein virus]|uniref:RNA replication protein n=1 Tax=Euonymus yellow vein virus TaxID=2013968 RepID=A0A218MK55_9VIRU|nr:RdRp protein [Euonymus yellow vein virus]ASE06180.1 RdRp protein [Euonymus yellow vein virus]
MSKVLNVLDRITDTSLKATIQEEAYQGIRQELKQIRQTNPFAASPEEAQCLEKLGIGADPYSLKQHTHAGAKAIENQMLSIVGSILPKEKVTFLFLKRSKLRYLRRSDAPKDIFLNQNIEAKDVCRYDSDTVYESLPAIETRCAYMSDTLHFLDCDFLMKMFADNPLLDTFHATVVLPVEALHKHPSIYPEIYKINYDRDGFQYIPGGHGGAAYHHEFETLKWLSVGRIQQEKNGDLGGDLCITCQLIESLGANHLLTFTRGKLKTPRLRVFQGNNLVTLPAVFHPKRVNANRPIKRTMATQLLLYVKSIASVTSRDIYAKLRQLIKTNELEDYAPDELIHLANYFLFVARKESSNSYESLLGANWWEEFTIPIRAKIRGFLEKFKGKDSFDTLLDALDWKTFTYTVPTTVVFAIPECLSDRKIWTATRAPDSDSESDDEEKPDKRENDRQEPRTKPDKRPVKPQNPNQEIKHSKMFAAELARNFTGASEKTVRKSCTLTPEVRTNTVFVSPPEVHVCEEVNYSSLDSIANSLPQVEEGSLTTGKETESDVPETEIKAAIREGKRPMLPEQAEGAHHKGQESRFEKPAGSLRIQEPTEESYKSKSTQETNPKSQKISSIKTPKESKEPGKLLSSEQDRAGRAKPKTRTEYVVRAKQATTEPCQTAEAKSSPITPDNPKLPWQGWMKILNDSGFEGLSRQSDSQGKLIFPIQHNQKLAKYPRPSSIPASLWKELERVNRLPVPHEFCQKRGAAYASDIKNGRVGMLLRQMSPEDKNTMSVKVENAEGKTVLTSVIMGCGGCGKSKFIQDWMRTLKRDEKACTIVCPTNELRMDWENKVPKLPRLTFKTFEKALIQPALNIVVMDDFGKLPNGYIELFAYTHPNMDLLILTGDSKQSTYHEENEQALTAQLDSAIEVFKAKSRFYLNATHRNRRDVANALGVYSENEKQTAVTMSSQVKMGWPILAPSIVKSTAMKEIGHRAYTYSGCQGLTTSKVQILLDSNTPLCSEPVLYTALSRAVEAIHFINTGPNAQEFWTKLDCTPYLKTFLSTVRERKTQEVILADTKPKEPEPPRTHVPVETDSAVFEDFVETMGEKHERELFSKSEGHSNTIQTEDTTVRMFQHQQAKDETLFWATVDARLKIATIRDNQLELLLKKDIGDVLFMNYQVAMCLPKEPIPFEWDLWESCAQEVQSTYLAKPIHMLMNGELRQSPDFDSKKIAVFLKSQWVKKVEKIGALKVKPGQTIASFMQETVMLFGTMARYMRRIREAFQPPNIFINCEKDIPDLDMFVKERWDFKIRSHENDFTAFDQSQDGAMLQFEMIKAKHHSIPEGIIEAYRQIKTEASIFLGTLAIMRLTGEGPTFDANTECSIAYHHTKYHVAPGTPQVYAGDDMAQAGLPEPKDSFKILSNRLSLVSKEVVRTQKPGDFASFCGWLITPLGVIKDPLKLYASLELAKRTGNLKDCKTSYALDAKFAYDLGDGIQDILSAEQLRYHQLTIRSLHLAGVGGRIVLNQ